MSLSEGRSGRTREALLEFLKRSGAADSASLARQLGVSAMAVRQHLYALAAEGLVRYTEESRPVGRPAKLWALTPAADVYFPDAHGDLAVGLLRATGEVFGEEGVTRLLAARARRQIEAYSVRVPAGEPLDRRVEALAALRTEEGYLAEARRGEDGAILLIENHCPVCPAAASCPGLCSAELDVFRSVLGDSVLVERTEHIVSGSRRCVYRVTEKAG